MPKPVFGFVLTISFVIVEKSVRRWVLLLNIALIIIACLEASYYFRAKDQDTLIFVPLKVNLLLLGYIVLQFLKRILFKYRNWWDWIYFIGMIGLILPVFFGEHITYNFLFVLTGAGVVLLILPPLLDSFKLLWYER